MTVNSGHICSKVVLSADYNGSETSAKLFMNKLPHHVNSALAYLSDELETMALLQHQSFRFNELIIDIGSIDERYFKDEFKNRLKKAILENIQMADLHPGKFGANSVIVHQSAETEQLIRHLLCYGFVPWWANTSGGLSFRELFKEFIQKKPERIEPLLLEIGHLPSVRSRLIYQLDQSDLFAIMKIISPSKRSILKEYLNLLSGFAKHSGMRETHLKHLVWDITLKSLIAENGQIFSSDVFLKQLMTGVFTPGKYNLNDFIRYVESEKVGRESGTIFSQLIPKLALETSSFQVKGSDKKKRSVGVEKEWETLNKTLVLSESEIRQVSKKSVRSFWNKVFERDLSASLKELKRLAGSGTVRRNLSIFLSDKELKQLVQRTEPSHAAFIIDHSTRLSQIKKSIPDMQVPAADLRAKSWEFILTYLFEDKGSRFNRKQFLKSTLEQFAAHFNLNYTDLLNYFIVFTSVEQSGSASAIHSILKELEKDEEYLKTRLTDGGSLKIAEVLKRATQKAKLVTFNRAAAYAIEIYQLSKEDPEALKKLLNSGSYNEEGLLYLWNFLTPSQMGIVLMAVSPSRITGWEQLMSEIELTVSNSSLIQQTIELNDVFDLVFHHGVLKSADMETLLNLYIDELAARNRVLRNKIELELADTSAADGERLLLKFLTHHNERANGQSYKLNQKRQKRQTNEAGQLLNRIDRLFFRKGSHHPGEVIDFFDSLSARELERASNYITAKRGWRILATSLPQKAWRRWIEIVSGAEICVRLLNVYDLYELIVRTEFDSDTSKKKLRKLRGLLSEIGMHASPHADIDQFIQLLLDPKNAWGADSFSKVTLESVKEQISSSLTPVFNRLIDTQTTSDKKEGHQKFALHAASSPEVERVLMLLKKLKQTDPDENDRLIYPQLLQSLESGNRLVRNTMYETLRSDVTLKRWAVHMPDAILQEYSEYLLAPNHLNKVKEVIDVFWPVFDDVLHGIDKGPFYSRLQFRYSARNRYKPFSPASVLKTALHITSDAVPSANRERELKKLVSKLSDHLMKHKVQGEASVRKMLETFDGKVDAGRQEEHTAIESEEANEIQMKTSFNMDDSMFEGESLYTTRAGLILAAPFLPTLFERLEYLENGKLPDNHSKSRAVHILEFLATGQLRVEEYELVIHKLLVGLPIQSPVEPLESLSEEEIEMSESMLNGMIANWDKLGHSTIEALREGFLIRDGVLQKSDEYWKLSVSTKGVDVLIDFIPWSIGVIKLPWMERMIQVEWR